MQFSAAPKLNILMLYVNTNQNIPLRTETAEVYGRYLVNSGHRLIVVPFLTSSKPLNKFTWNNIEFYPLPLKRRIFRIKFIQNLIKENDINIVQACDSGVHGLMALLVSRKNKIFLTYQCTWPTWEMMNYLFNNKIKYLKIKYWKFRIDSYLQIQVMQQADIVFSVSTYIKDDLIKKGVKEEKIILFEDGFSPITFASTISGEEIKVKFNLVGYSVLIYQGTMAKIRELEILIRAFKLVLMNQDKVKLFMVGDGDGLENLKKLAKELNIENSIIFTGRVPYEEVPEYIAASDIGISPIPPINLYKISSPLKLFEYMAMAKPVVANEEIFEHNNVLKESKGGILVPYDPEHFANAINALLDNPDEAKEMGRNGLVWVTKNRSYETLAKQIEKAYYKLFK